MKVKKCICGSDDLSMVKQEKPILFINEKLFYIKCNKCFKRSIEAHDEESAMFLWDKEVENGKI